MSSPRLDDDSFSVDFSLELLSAFEFSGFELPGGSLFSFGSYENEYDDASFSFSVESYVGVRNQNQCRRKTRRPNRQFRKKRGFWLSMDHSLGQETTKKSLRTIPMFISVKQDDIKTFCGIITQQKAELSRIAVHI